MKKAWFDNFSNINLSETIELRKEIQREIYKKNIMVNSLTDTILHFVQSIYMPISSGILEKAWHQQSEKKKSDRREYEFVKDEMIRSFFKANKKEVSLDKIVCCGYDTYAYNLYFKYHKVHFEIVYPCPNNITENWHLDHTDYGKYILRYEAKNGVWSWITSSYEAEDIAKAIEEFINAKEAKAK